MRVRFGVILVLSACNTRHEQAPPSPPPPRVDAAPAPSAATVPRSTLSDSQIAWCEKENHVSAFQHCPVWRMAMPSACGSRDVPEAVNPCRCMCDLCERDQDCNAHDRSDGRCVTMPSVARGSYEEKVCVYAGESCHPSGHCPKGQICVTRGGTTGCETRIQE